MIVTKTKVPFEGAEYPVQFNMLVFNEWAKETGKSMDWLSEIAAKAKLAAELQKKGEPIPDDVKTTIDDGICMIKLLYFGIADACEETETDFPYTVKNFVRRVSLESMAELTSYIKLTDHKEESSPKKRLPKAPDDLKFENFTKGQ